MKKKMIIYMSKISVGGMERAFINLINMSNFTKNYEVTVYAPYSIEKTYLEELESKVKVIILCKGKWNLFGKMVCAFKMIIDLIKLTINPKPYDVSISYPYQHPILSLLARKASNNSVIFIHSNLKMKYGDKIGQQMKKMQYDKFSKVICVSNDALNCFKDLYPNYQGVSLTINNYIDGEAILKLSKEKKAIDVKHDNLITFINIARHEEKSKKITRIIEASNRLKRENYKFQVWLIGDGEDTPYYQKLIEKYHLEKEVLLLGKKINPYVYLKMADCFLLSSAYEGYGIVLDEARILDKPFISTTVADAKIIAEAGYGIICENSKGGVYQGMKEYLEKGYSLKVKFNYRDFNNRITKLLDETVSKKVKK